jgi:hypothetical protein
MPSWTPALPSKALMKSICDTLQWTYEKGARASDLIKVLREHRLFPDYLDKSFDQLLAILKSGLPKIRNYEGSHGQGSVLKRVPAHAAAYAIHLAATNIVFLVECMKEFQPQASKKNARHHRSSGVASKTKPSNLRT